jgi:hypothetical protein
MLMKKGWPVGKHRGDDQARDANVNHPQQPKQNSRETFLG